MEQNSVSRQGSSNFYEFFRGKIYTFIKWFYRENNRNLLFVFLGLPRSGKTTAIKNIFGEPTNRKPVPGNPHETLATEIASSDSKTTILDVRSISSSKMMEANAQILASLHSYLGKRGYIPTIVFITARLSDSRFVGESSEFKMALKAISLLKNELTDTTCSNIVLLLTHADRPDIQETKPQRVQAYKDAFKTVFNVEPVCIIISDAVLPNNASQENSEHTQTLSCFHGLFFEFIRSLQSNELPFQLQATRALDGYTSVTRKLQYDLNVYDKLLNGLRGINDTSSAIISNISEPSIVDLPLAVTDKYLQVNSFGNYKVYSNLQNPPEETVYNLFSSGSSILLPNKNLLNITKCMIGQRVYGVNAPVAIVTNIFPIFGDAFCNGGSKLCGRVYMKASNVHNGNRGWEKCVMYTRGDFVDAPIRNAPRIGNSSTDLVYYYVEVNGGNDPFIVDRYVCYSTGRRCVSSEFDFLTQSEIPI